MKKTARAAALSLIPFAVLLSSSGTANARSEKEVCSKPKFSGFKPKKGSEVSPGSDFSFRAPASIAPNSVEATVKQINVKLTVQDKNEFYVFKGKLPDSLNDTYARITVKGKSDLGCRGRDGWLIKISGKPAAATQSSSDTPQPAATSGNTGTNK